MKVHKVQASSGTEAGRRQIEFGLGKDALVGAAGDSSADPTSSTRCRRTGSAASGCSQSDPSAS